jgi:porphobilinogen synthase
MPIFINESLASPRAIKSLPGIYQHAFTSLMDEVDEIVSVGIKAVLLFGIPEKKDEQGSEADNPKGVVQLATEMIKAKHPDLVVIADCCLCEYTIHGECGILKNSKLDNDQTLSRLAKIAISYAQAGVDIIAPSGMMDGMVIAIRRSLDQASFHHIPIMSYAVKYASSLYGPFREAAGSSQFQGDRRHHQLSPTQRREALLEAQLDNYEGADFVMIKPSLMYMDIIRELRNTYHQPIVAYNVSGEYAMIKTSAAQGILNEQEVFHELFISLKRSGADLIISYYAKEMAKLLK